MSQKSMAGQYKRWTATLPPEQVEHIKKLARQNDMSALAFFRWMVDLALVRYEEGARPEVTERVVRGEAKLGHWSSKSS